MIIDGYAIKEIEVKVTASKEAEAIQALMIFGYAVEHNHCKHNPALLIKAARVGNRRKRTRWLTTPEIRRYLTGLYQSNCYRG
ncbi:MAG: hypothetical protein ACU88J_15375 [Gammaproteobacteria bacterium]